MSKLNDFMHKVELSSLMTVLGIILLFSGAVTITLIAPRHIDPSWIQPTSAYQVQMYEIADPNLYISSVNTNSSQLQAVYHLKKDFTLLAFQETETVRIVAPPHLEKYITKYKDPTLKLTSNLLLLRTPDSKKAVLFHPKEEADKLNASLQENWEKEHPDWKEKGLHKLNYQIMELYEPERDEAFASAPTDHIVENWVDNNYIILDESTKHAFHKDPGVIYVNNPIEYKISHYNFGSQKEWRYDPDNGQPILNIQDLKNHALGFKSRKELIEYGEHLYAIEGCWYCHTDQTRTLVQDVVLNGSDSFPAPPSSANEYIYQNITFPGTRRIGPDISRVGVKRPSRDWHQSHFWTPKNASQGSIMPSFRHFFDYDPRGTSTRETGIPNYKFEAMFQYLMTKGTRITPPTEAWWLGKDPVQTKEIIEGQRKLR